jgi:hypothetical protein
MTERGMTKVPCEGCGGARHEGRPRERGQLCRECRRLLDYALAQAAAARPGRVVLTLPSSSSALSGLRYGAQAETDALRRTFRALLCSAADEQAPPGAQPGAEVWELLASSGLKAPRGEGSPWTYWPVEDEQVRLIDPQLLADLAAVWKAVCAIAASAYEEGLQRGRGLLAALARGELTAAEFNEEEARLSSNRRDIEKGQ